MILMGASRILKIAVIHILQKSLDIVPWINVHHPPSIGSCDQTNSLLVNDVLLFPGILALLFDI